MKNGCFDRIDCRLTKNDREFKWKLKPIQYFVILQDLFFAQSTFSSIFICNSDCALVFTVYGNAV